MNVIFAVAIKKVMFPDKNHIFHAGRSICDFILVQAPSAFGADAKNGIFTLC